MTAAHPKKQPSSVVPYSITGNGIKSRKYALLVIIKD
jgi:hypothetical protein